MAKSAIAKIQDECNDAAGVNRMRAMHAAMAAVAANEEQIDEGNDDRNDGKDDEQQRCVRVGDGAENNAERNVAYPRCTNVTFAGMVLDLNAVVPGE